MSNHQSGNSPAELDKKLATYWQLVEEREALEARVSRARNEKDSVPERIFSRVMAEYETALETVTVKLTPLQEEFDALRRSLDADLKTVDATIQETEDNIAEARFRHRVGEFDADTVAGVVGRLDATLNESRQQRDALATQLAAMDRRRSDRSDAAQPSPAAAQPAQSPQPAPAPPASPAQPAQPAPAAAKPDDDPLLELRESSMVAGVSAGAPATGNGGDASPAADHDDPLSALSDPSPARESESGKTPAPTRPAAQTQPASQSRATAVAPSYPSLVIRSGVHEGKIVPLLPITMSIGREHDNNIELKDEEVSRYHARIVYEDGRFVVEDLESSSGTWINGVRQRRAALSDGDVVRIGTTELLYEVA